MQLIDADEGHSRIMDADKDNSRIIDLTGDDQSVAEFVDLSKDLEVVDLCSSSDSSSDSSNDSSLVDLSKLMPCGLLQHQSSDVLTSTCSSGTGGRAGLPHPRLIGTLIKFCRQGGHKQDGRGGELEARSSRRGTKNRRKGTICLSVDRFFARILCSRWYIFYV